METKNNISTSEIDKELLDKVKLAVRYGYSYRKVAQAQFNKTSKINYCIPEASDILIELGSLILSGVAWDSIKAIAKSIYSNYKKSNKTAKIDKETEFVLVNEKELYKFNEYIKEFENGLSNIPEEEYKYIEEEMMADFCSEMLSEIYIKEKRIATTEETIQITKTAMIKINKLIKR